MEFNKDIGKFVTLSYKTPDGKYKLVFGRLDIDEEGFLLFYNVKDSNMPSKRVNPNEVVIVDYSAKQVEVNR